MDSSARQMLEQANRLHHQGIFQEARAVYEKVLSVDPNDVNALHYLGLLLHQTADSSTGLPMLRRSVELAPDCGAVLATTWRWCSRSTARFQSGPSTSFPAVVELQPSHADAYARLGVMPAGDQSIARSRTSHPPFNRAAGQISDAQSHNNLGSILRELARDEEAAAAVRAAIQLDPKKKALPIQIWARRIARWGDTPEAVSRLAGVAVELSPSKCDRVA